MRGRGWNPCTGCDPLVICHEWQAELVVEDTQVSVAATHNRVWSDSLHLLCHHADIGFVAAVVAEAIKSKAIVEMTKQGDVVLERDVRASSAAAAASAAATASAATAHARATAAAAHARATTTAASAETRVSA